MLHTSHPLAPALPRKRLMLGNRAEIERRCAENTPNTILVVFHSQGVAMQRTGEFLQKFDRAYRDRGGEQCLVVI